DKCEIIWASDIVKDPAYWEKVINIAKNTTIARATRCLTIMGRNEDEAMETAQLFYPMMQVADIFHLNVNVCQLGMDQRKANMLAREVGEKIGYWKPSAVHHHIMAGLKGPSRMDVEGKSSTGNEFEDKMSKSKKGSAIFIHDPPDVVRKKIKDAHCVAGEVKNNPILEIAKYIIFRRMDVLEIKRKPKFGGDVQYENYEELEEAFLHPKASKGIHPLDLKFGIADALNELLAPVQEFFDKHEEYMEVFDEEKVTR
ncbi:tyrosine--tRNA ligase, partial [Candidatus Bathyarchaeota archaeon]|nr:tyrosine--tRNA ligase [Candidatus Bathyarchaeota archaeon]